MDLEIDHVPTWKKRRNLILPDDKRPRNPRISGRLSRPAYFDARLAAKYPRKRLPEGYPAYRYARTATAAQEYRQPDPKPVKVHVHADMLRVTYTDRAKGMDTGGPAHGGGKRGTVAGFSRASRKRMFEFMASVRNTGSMLFLTMTFDDTTAINSDDWLTACFETFRRRFERAYPKWRALWRKEGQDRKSGDYQGMVVPHYHLIVFTGVHYEKAGHEAVCESFREWGALAWQEITGTEDQNHLVYGFHVSPVRSRKHAYSYIGKYIGKTDSHNFTSGRQWGRIGRFDTSSSETFALDPDEYIAFRRLIKKWLRTRAQVPGPDAPPEEVEKWLLREKKQRRYSCRFARGSASAGCTVFGLGDTTASGEPQPLDAPFAQFVFEARRQMRDRREHKTGIDRTKNVPSNIYRNLQ